MSDPRLAGLSAEQRAQLFQKLRAKKRQDLAEPREAGGPRRVQTSVPALVPALLPRNRAAGDPPLSFAQQRLWFLDRLMPGDSMYNIPLRLDIAGPLDAGRLGRALAALVARHEALRTTFRLPAETAAEPVQVIAPEAGPGLLPVVDLSGLPAQDEGKAEADRLAEADAVHPFDLAAGPLLRALLLRLAPERHELLVAVHHIVSDGWSTGVLIRDLTTLYDGGALPELPVQYADYALWQRRWLAGAVLEGQLAHWRQRLAGMPASLDLPADRPRPPLRGSRGAVAALRVERETAARLKELGRRQGTTLFTVLLALFQALLHRLTGQEDLAVAAPVAGRNRPEVAGLIGFFINTLVLRGDLAGDPGIAELVGRLREVTLDAFEHQDVPFERLVEELRPRRDPSRPPLAQVMLVLQNVPMAALAMGGLRLAPLPMSNGTAKLDLTLAFGEEDGGLAGTLTYARDLFDAPTAQRLADRFVLLAEAAAADPRRPLSTLPLLTAPEEAQVLREWTDTPGLARLGESGEAGEGASVPALFQSAAARFPERTAVVCGERSLTYRALARRVARLAGELRRRGVGPEVRVALALDRSVSLVEGLLAVLTAGGAYVPLDPALPAARRAELLALSGAALVLASPESALAEPALAESVWPEAVWPESLPEGQPRVVVVADGEESDLADAEDLPDLAAIPLASAAYVLFTSGSTGAPKGVVVEHRQLLSYMDGADRRLGLGELAEAGAAFGLVSTFAADLGNTVVFPALCGGGSLHVVPAATALDPEAFARSTAEHPLDVLKIVPSHLQGLLQSSRPEGVLPRRLLVLGGEAAPWELIDRVAELAPACRIANHYGPTEATVGAVAQPIVVSSRPRPHRPPLGRPLHNVEAHVLDPRQRPVPGGVPGELWLGGGGLARGYLGRPDLTAERFAPHPLSGDTGNTGRPGERLYRTGDRVRWLPDGSLEFLGRVDRQVKIRGFRVEPGEVEAALARHPAVAACAVLVRAGGTSESEGEGTAAGLTACVVLRECGADGAETLRTLRTWLAGLLPAPLVPAGWLSLEALPLTANGKVDREALARIAAEGAGGLERPEEAAAPPRTAVERELAAVWAEVLGVERVGIGESFFDLGGHSLLLPRVQAALRERLGREVSLLKLFEHPTVEALAAWLEGGAEAAVDSGGSRDRVRRQRQGLELQRQRLVQRRTS